MRTRSNNFNEIAQLVDWGCEQCHKTSDSPQLDAEILLMHVLKKPRSYCRTWPEKYVSEELVLQYKDLIASRIKPTPIAYLVGYKEFWSRNFKVNQSTLIPRPDTELLIEHALTFLHQRNTAKNILDLGTGSGCIAITLQKEYPNCQMMATDISAGALAVARYNAHALSADVTFIESSWFTHIPQQTFDLIASNPPYIALNDEHLLQGDLPAEPITALTSGKNGLDDIKIIAKNALEYLTPEGMLMIEHGHDQREDVFNIFEQNGYYHIKQYDDLGQQARLTIGRKVLNC